MDYPKLPQQQQQQQQRDRHIEDISFPEKGCELDMKYASTSCA
jgi:hypothetical protein